MGLRLRVRLRLETGTLVVGVSYGVAAKAKGAMPTRDEVVAALRASRFQGIAYARPVTWDAKGDNTSAVIMLNVVEDDHFKEIGEVTREELAR